MENNKEQQTVDRIKDTIIWGGYRFTEFMTDDIVYLLEKYFTYQKALEEIDCHIRSTSHPVSNIVQTLKKTLPEYRSDKND